MYGTPWDRLTLQDIQLHSHTKLTADIEYNNHVPKEMSRSIHPGYTHILILVNVNPPQVNYVEQMHNKGDNSTEAHLFNLTKNLRWSKDLKLETLSGKIQTPSLLDWLHKRRTFDQ